MGVEGGQRMKRRRQSNVKYFTMLASLPTAVGEAHALQKRSPSRGPVYCGYECEQGSFIRGQVGLLITLFLPSDCAEWVSCGLLLFLSPFSHSFI